jgi:hypothetical protein
MAGLLDRPVFDGCLIVGTVALALSGGITAWLVPVLFVPILLADLWGLGYHHVIATYTRLGFDRRSRREHQFLLYGLPLLVLAGVLLLILALGIWSIPTLYFYWQWFHYTRQSYGVCQVYRRKGKVAEDVPPWLQQATFYAVPLWGILYRSATAPEQFLGMEFRAAPVPLWLADAVGGVALGLLLWWIVRCARAARERRFPILATAYMASHFLVFIVGYRLMPTLDHGWLIVNIWHNAQYLLFVWLFNRNRFKGGVAPEARLLSWAVQPGRAWAYFGLCLLISTSVYLALGEAAAAIAAGTALPISLIVFQVVNFHHYIVDALIWKVRKAPLRATLALNA